MSEMESSMGLDNVRELETNEWNKILEKTPENQAIMAVGLHGIGKSEMLKNYYESKGYKVIMLFLGQMADAGDLIGLPDRSTVTFNYNGESVTQKITEFCPPKWFPRNENDKIVIFLDEFNRGKQEVYQCIMDMVLNKQINGLKLPEHTRIVAAINPLDDKYGYQVNELDPALLDRFNVYGFKPSRKEWLYWAINEKVHKLVIAFIAKFGAAHLDPPSNGKMGVVYPSRRSWKKVSDFLNNNPDVLMEEEFVFLRDWSVGVIGETASAAFYAFLKEQKKGINPGTVLTAWNDDLEQKVKSLSNQDLLMFNAELAMHIEEECDTYFGEHIDKRDQEGYGYNVWCYLKSVPREILADFMDYIGDATVEHKKEWPNKLLSSSPSHLVDNFIQILHGNSPEEKEQEDDHFKDNDIDDIINGI